MATDALCDLLLGQTEVVDQGLEGTRLIDRIELLALKVLDQRQLEHPLVGHVPPHHGRYAEQTSELCRAPASLTGDQLEAVAGGTDDDRLKDAVLLQGGREFGQPLVVEGLARLLAVRPDPVDVDRPVAVARRRRLDRDARSIRRPGNQTAQAAPQCFACHGP